MPAKVSSEFSYSGLVLKTYIGPETKMYTVFNSNGWVIASLSQHCFLRTYEALVISPLCNIIGSVDQKGVELLS